jgi:uncharacterized protein (DUF2236 family)
VPRSPTLREVFIGFPRAPEAGREGDPGLFPVGSIARTINAETILLLGGGRALLMQIAHPLVAAGVADHSGFPGRPFARLWRTLDTTLRVSFGDADQSRDAAARVTGVHRRVRGERGGTPYRAMDPDLLLWVHATLVDTALVTYERFVRPLGEPARQAYYREMSRQALAFGVPPEALPADLATFLDYVSSTVQRLEVTDEARALAADILRPPAPRSLAPVASAMRLITIGTLPEPLRARYGTDWSPGRERLLDAVAAVSRGAVPLLPSALRRWPHARAAAARIARARRDASDGSAPDQNDGVST